MDQNRRLKFIKCTKFMKTCTFLIWDTKNYRIYFIQDKNRSYLRYSVLKKKKKKTCENIQTKSAAIFYSLIP